MVEIKKEFSAIQKYNTKNSLTTTANFDRRLTRLTYLAIETEKETIKRSKLTEFVCGSECFYSVCKLCIFG